MSDSSAYTPLETLLLFQALRSEGVDSYSVFPRISNQLKNISIVRNDPRFDSGRLSPDALRELYLWLLKEEVKRDLERQFERESVLQNGNVSPNSRKRKAPSPNLPTVREASQHAHLIPQLVTRLYTRYRDHTVREIREHERKYDALSREIGEIEVGKWDERLQRQRTAPQTQSPRPATNAHFQSTLIKQDVTQRATTASPKSPHTTLENNSQALPRPYKVNKIGDVINHGPEPQNDPSNHRRNSSTTTLPPLSEMAPQSPHFGIPPKVSGPISHSFNQSPPSTHRSPYASHHGHPTPGSIASPGVQNSLSRPSSSSSRPILPPPPGMTLPPPSPTQHSGPTNLRGPPLPPQQHYYPHPPPHRLSTGPSPTNERAPTGYPSPQIPPPPAGYYQQASYPDRRTSYPPPLQQHALSTGPPTYPTHAPHAGGYQLPPFALEAQESTPGRTNQLLAQQPRTPVPHPSSVPVQRPQYAQYVPNAPSTSQRRGPPQDSRRMSDIIAALGTPDGRKSAWKRSRNLPTGTPMPSPPVEPLSPVLKRSEPTARSTRSAPKRDATVSEPSVETESLPKATRGRGRPKRARSPHSVVSSTADESARMTRSHSASTAAGAIPTSDDRPGSRGNVKAEPSTPAGLVDAPDVAHEIPSVGGPMTRKRRGTLQSQPQPVSKRRRQQSPDHESEELGTPPPRPNTVLATRNFHKMSATIMNDINSHKHASYFSNLVRDKDAPGYSEIIKQPQHFKSIRAAINAGSKALNAAAAALESPSATDTPTRPGADGSTTVELERTEELMPPKAIVNSAQLEKEIMRMFANAVMFNPGEDGMVSDTREMFEDVEAKLAQWRGAEKGASDADGGEEEGKGKRRKL